MKITLDEAHALMDTGAVLIDVRDRELYNRKHLPGAINLPYCDIHGLAFEHLKDLSQPLIIYCTTGKRSLQAKSSLECLGFETIYCLTDIEKLIL